MAAALGAWFVGEAHQLNTRVAAADAAGQDGSAPGGGSTSAKLAEWARDHYLGPVVTFGEWITYNPPKAGGKPGFSLAAPGGTTPARDYKKTHGFVPDIPQKLTSPAGKPLADGQAGSSAAKGAPMRLFHLSIAYLTLLFAAVAVTSLLPWGRW